MTPENIARNHRRWHPKDEGETGLQTTSDFLHYRYYFFEGKALLDLGRAAEAAKKLEAKELSAAGVETHEETQSVTVPDLIKEYELTPHPAYIQRAELAQDKERPSAELKAE